MDSSMVIKVIRDKPRKFTREKMSRARKLIWIRQTLRCIGTRTWIYSEQGARDVRKWNRVQLASLDAQRKACLQIRSSPNRVQITASGQMARYESQEVAWKMSEKSEGCTCGLSLPNAIRIATASTIRKPIKKRHSTCFVMVSELDLQVRSELNKKNMENWLLDSHLLTSFLWPPHPQPFLLNLLHFLRNYMISTSQSNSCRQEYLKLNWTYSPLWRRVPWEHRIK